MRLFTTAISEVTSAVVEGVKKASSKYTVKIMEYVATIKNSQEFKKNGLVISGFTNETFYDALITGAKEGKYGYQILGMPIPEDVKKDKAKMQSYLNSKFIGSKACAWVIHHLGVKVEEIKIDSAHMENWQADPNLYKKLLEGERQIHKKLASEKVQGAVENQEA